MTLEQFTVVDKRLTAFCEEFIKRYERRYQSDFNRDFKRLCQEESDGRKYCSLQESEEQRRFYRDYYEVRNQFLVDITPDEMMQIYFSPRPKEIAERLKIGIGKLRSDWEKDISRYFDEKVDDLIKSSEELAKPEELAEQT